MALTTMRSSACLHIWVLALPYHMFLLKLQHRSTVAATMLEHLLSGCESVAKFVFGGIGEQGLN